MSFDEQSGYEGAPQQDYPLSATRLLRSLRAGGARWTGGLWRVFWAEGGGAGDVEESSA